MIFGIGGQKQHGKDTVALYLVKEYGYSKLAFADKLKAICQRLYPHINFYDEANKETLFNVPSLLSLGVMNQLKYEIECCGYSIDQKLGTEITNVCSSKKELISVRDILQFVGTDILRNLIDADFHYNSVKNSWKQFDIKKGVASDCRFENERLNLKRDFNSKTILVERPSMQANSSSNHASEKSLGSHEDYDYIIINDGSLQDLYDKVDSIMEDLGINKQ